MTRSNHRSQYTVIYIYHKWTYKCSKGNSRPPRLAALPLYALVPLQLRLLALVLTLHPLQVPPDLLLLRVDKCSKGNSRPPRLAAPPLKALVPLQLRLLALVLTLHPLQVPPDLLLLRVDKCSKGNSRPPRLAALERSAVPVNVVNAALALSFPLRFPRASSATCSLQPLEEKTSSLSSSGLPTSCLTVSSPLPSTFSHPTF